MKKNKYSLSLSLKFLCRVVLLTILGTSFLFFSVKGDPVEPQRVTLNLKDVSLSVLFQEIKKQTSYKFFYNDTQEKQMGKISISVSNETVEKVLEKVFSGKEYTCKISGEQIIVVKRQETKKSAQEVVIEGLVLERDSMPIIGATVLLQGTTTGVATDVNGKFRFVVPMSNEIYIEVSFLGMKKQVHKVLGLPNPKPMRIVMLPETMGVDEVIVTGYANIRKESFTGAATTVTKEEILRISPRNVIDVLQVFDPSLRMVKNNEMGSDPNTLPEFYIRGRTGMDGVTQLDKLEAQQGGNMSKFSLTTNPNLPVFILDGYEVEVQKIYDMDPNRIASITILKDAAATAMYGSRASNGVIVVETVTPELGKLQVAYSFNASLTVPDLSDYNLMNAEEKLQAELLSGLYDLSTANGMTAYVTKKNYITKGVDTDWMSQPLQNQFNHSHSLYISGGTEGFRFGTDLSYNHEGGVMKKSYRNRMSVGIYVDYRVGKLQIRNNVSYDLARSSDSPYGSFSDYTKQQPYYPIYDDNGKLLQMLAIGIPNPLYEATLGNFSRGESSNLTNNLSFYWFINDHLQLQSQFSVTKNDSEDKDFTDPLSTKYGSSLGLYHFLDSQEKTVNVIVPNAFPDFLRWMPGSKDILLYDRYKDFADKLIAEADVICCLDFNALKRIDDMADAVAASPARKIMIDHHLYPEDFCKIVMSYPKISSTSELIFRLICRMGYFSDISKEGAECIYTGMMTDTGGFTYNSNNREIYFIISELLSKGIDKDDIYRKVYNTYSESRLRLMGYVLSNMTVYSDYNSALITLTKAEQSKFNYIKGDSEGFVNIPLSIKNVCFSCFLREDTEKPMIKISLRSVGTFPCNQLAAEFFHGGGHLNASGGEFFGTMEEAKAVFEKALEKYKPLLTAKS